MQRAARRQLTRYLTCHFYQHRIFLMNCTFPQYIKAPAEDHRHYLHWILHKLFSVSHPSRFTLFQNCIHLSSLLRCLSTGSLLPSEFDEFPTTNQSVPDRNNIEDIEETQGNCVLVLNASEPAFDNTKVLVGMILNGEERSDDAMSMEAGKVDPSSDLLSHASRQQGMGQVKKIESCKVRDDVATGVFSSTGGNAKSLLCQPCARQSNEKEFGTSCETSVLRILEKQGWGQHIEDVLHSFIGQLTADVVEKIVDGLRDAKVAFSFLQWVGMQENYQHREEVFTKVVGRLGKDKDFEMAWRVLHYMRKHGLNVDYTFSIFIQRLKSVNMADYVVKAMESMMILNVVPTISLYMVALQVMLKTNNFKMAGRLYNQMRQAGLQPDTRLFGALIDGFGKGGMVVHALFFFKEMQRDGVSPNSFAYTRLIRAFAIAGQYVEGQRFFAEMIQKNCLPMALSRNDLECALFGANSIQQISWFLRNLESSGHLISIHTYNSVIQYLLDKKMLMEAVELFQRFLGTEKLQGCDNQRSPDSKVTRPNKVSYSLIICGLCNGGQLTQAILLFREMLVNGICSTSDICNCLLHGLSSNEGYMYEAVELARHMASKKLIVDVETQKMFFKASKASGDMAKALAVFNLMKGRGCIDSSSNFHTVSNVEG